MKSRIVISILLLALSGLALYRFCDNLFFYTMDFYDLNEIGNRLLAVIIFGFVGISIRSFRMINRKESPFWIIVLDYFVRYPITVSVISFFIFSFLSMNEKISNSYLFYTFSFPISFIVGYFSREMELVAFKVVEKLDRYIGI